MIRSLAAALAVLSLATTIAVAQTAPKTAAAQAPAQSKLMASFQGVWVMKSSNGQEIPAGGPTILITITGNKYVQTVDGQEVESGTFKVDDTKKPMSLDLLIAMGDDAGKTQLGVFELKDNVMSGKLAEPGTTTRPTDLVPAEGWFTFVMVKK